MGETVVKANLAARIRDALTERVTGGRLAPGERLVELAIAREFGTSQAPVREALRMLEAVGLVESVPHKGTRVRAIGDRELFESYATRAILEEGAARYAAAHVFARSPGAVAELRASFAAQLEAAHAGDLAAVARHNADFHRRVVTAAGNRALADAWESLGIESRGTVTLTRKAYDVVAATRQHEPIVDSLCAGDGEAAGRLIREHGLFFARLHDTGPESWAAQTLSGEPEASAPGVSHGHRLRKTPGADASGSPERVTSSPPS